MNLLSVKEPVNSTTLTGSQEEIEALSNQLDILSSNVLKGCAPELLKVSSTKKFMKKALVEADIIRGRAALKVKNEEYKTIHKDSSELVAKICRLIKLILSHPNSEDNTHASKKLLSNIQFTEESESKKILEMLNTPLDILRSCDETKLYAEKILVTDPSIYLECELETMPFQLLKALGAKRITVDQFATHMTAWAAMSDYGKCAVSIEFLSAMPDSFAEKTLRKTFKVGAINSLFTEEKFRAFKLKYSGLPESEKRIDHISSYNFAPLLPRLNHLNALFMLLEYSRMKAPKLHMPSAGMLRLANEVLFGENAVNPIYILDKVTQERIKTDYEQDAHIVGLSFPGIQEFDTADKMHCGRLGFVVHDWYHIYVAGTIPKKHREIHNLLNQTLHAFINKQPESEHLKKLPIYNIFNDLEFGAYRRALYAHSAIQFSAVDLYATHLDEFLSFAEKIVLHKSAFIRAFENTFSTEALEEIVQNYFTRVG